MPTDHYIAIGSVAVSFLLFIVVIAAIVFYERRIQRLTDAQPQRYFEISQQAVNSERRYAEALEKVAMYEAAVIQSRKDADARVTAAELDSNVKVQTARAEYEKLKQANRDQSVKQSKAVISGKVLQEIAPLLAEFPYSFHDARHIGASPVDYLVFAGLNEPAAEVDVVFLEIKTGVSALNAAEKRVRSAIDAGRVRYEIMRVHVPAARDGADDTVLVPASGVAVAGRC